MIINISVSKNKGAKRKLNNVSNIELILSFFCNRLITVKIKINNLDYPPQLFFLPLSKVLQSDFRLIPVCKYPAAAVFLFTEFIEKRNAS